MRTTHAAQPARAEPLRGDTRMAKRPQGGPADRRANSLSPVTPLEALDRVVYLLDRSLAPAEKCGPSSGRRRSWPG